MSYLLLSEDGIFPITRDKSGLPLTNRPSTGFDFPGTFQGEGKLMGIPSLFVRLSGCNLRCTWKLPDNTICFCDTPYASFDVSIQKKMDINEMISVIQQNSQHINHLVITGGEPLLQKDGLIEFCKIVKEKTAMHLTLETNGTRYDEKLADYIDLFSISPKLSGSVPLPEDLAAAGYSTGKWMDRYDEKRINLKVIQQYIDRCNTFDSGKSFQLKFVVSTNKDEQEIKSVVLEGLSGYKSDDILIMPLGRDAEELEKTAPKAVDIAVKNGWRYSPRIHIDFFGKKMGV